MFCAVSLVERLYVEGGGKGCCAAVFSVREVPALDESVRETHLCSCASVSFLGVVQHLFFVLRYSLSSVTRFRTTIRVGFFIAAHVVQLFLSGSHVFTQGGAFEHNTQVRWHRPRSWRKSHGRPCCVE